MVAATALLLPGGNPHIAEATDVTLVDNTGQSHSANLAVDNGNAAANRFRTGSDRYGYAVSSIDIAFGSAGSVTDLEVSIREGSGTEPGDKVATLNNPDSLSSNSLNTFTKNVTLQPSTHYYLVVERTGTAIFGELSTAAGDDQSSDYGWTIANGYRFRNNNTWGSQLTNSLRFKVNGAPRTDANWLSNFNETLDTEADLTDGGRLAAKFTTGSDTRGYEVDSLELKVGSLTGSVSNLTVEIRDGSGTNPGSLVSGGTFTNPATLTANSNNTFTASGLTLQAGTSYFLVVTGAGTAGIGSFQYTVSTGESSDYGWTVADSGHRLYDGSSWGSETAVLFFRFKGTFPLSDDANLSSLSVSPGTLDPTFDKDKSDYRVILGANDSAVTITATTSDGNATVVAKRGTTQLGDPTQAGGITVNPSVGKYSVSMIVTAENGDDFDYSITFIRPAGAPTPCEALWCANMTAVNSVSPGVDTSYNVGFDSSHGVLAPTTFDIGSVTYTVEHLRHAVSIDSETGALSFQLDKNLPDGTYLLSLDDGDIAEQRYIMPGGTKTLTLAATEHDHFWGDGDVVSVRLEEIDYLVSNLAEGNVRQAALTNTQKYSTKFTTGSDRNGYRIDTVELNWDRADRTSVGNVLVTIDDGSAANPGSVVATLANPSAITAGANVFTASDAVLDPSTTYFLTVTASGGTINDLDFTENDGQTGQAGWTIANKSRHYTGSAWEEEPEESLKFEIKGSVSYGLVSNLHETFGATQNLSSTVSKFATKFTTGPSSSGWKVDSIDLLFLSSPSGLSNLTVTINDSSGSTPGDIEATLTNPSSLSEGVNTFTATDLTLTGGTSYFVVMTASGNVTKISGTQRDGEEGEDGWTIANSGIALGNTWNHSATLMFRVNGEVAISSDADLSALSVSPGTLKPAFNRDREDYQVPLANSVTRVTITATKSDDNATIDYKKGGTTLTDAVSGGDFQVDITNDGLTEIELEVTAENDDTKSYFIKFIRAAGRPATCDDAIWCANLTGEEGAPYNAEGDYVVGFSSTQGFGFLAPSTLDHGTRTISVENLNHIVDGQTNDASNLLFGLSIGLLPGTSGTYKLVIGSETHTLTASTGVTVQPANHSQDWSAGDIILVKLLGPPSPPRNLTATAVSANRIDLSWDAPLTPAGTITGYKVEWSPNGTSNWTTLAASHGSTSYSDTSVAKDTTRHYRVFAINAEGTSYQSNTDSATTPDIDETGPSFTSAVLGATGTHIDVTMNETLDRASNRLPFASAFSVTADGVSVTVSSLSAPSGQPRVVALSLASVIYTGQTVLLSYTDPTTSNDSRALQDTTGNDADTFSNRTVTNNSAQEAPPTDPPPQVTGLRLTSGRDFINVSWSAADTATGYRVEWKSGTLNYSSARRTEVTNTSTRISSLLEETEYTVRVTAFNDIGYGTPSDERSTTTSLPTNKHIMSVEAVSAVVTEGESARFILRKENELAGDVRVRLNYWGQPGIPLENGPGSNSRVFPGDTAGEEEMTIVIPDDDWPYPAYTLTVWIESDGRIYRRVAEATVTVLDNDSSVRKAPQAPYRLDVVNGNGEVRLYWDPPRSDGGSAIAEYEYRVRHRWTDEGVTSGWVETNSTATSLHLTGLENDVQNWSYYTIEVRAINAVGRGATATAHARPSANPDLAGTPTRPQKLTATPDASGNVVLSWTKPLTVSGQHEITGYEYTIQTRPSSGPETWSSWWRSTGSEGTGFTVPASLLHSDRPYVFKVRAVNANGHGRQTNDVRATPVGGPVSADDTTRQHDLLISDGAEPDPLTASWQKKPRQHDGATETYARVLFTEDIANDPAHLPGAFTITGATINSVSRVEDRSDLFEVRFTPTGADPVTLQLTARFSCAADSDPCTSDGRELARNLDLVIAGPGWLRGNIGGLLRAHDGENAFKVDVHFNRDITASYRRFHHVFQVTGGTATQVRTVNGNRKHWELTIQPDGLGRVGITLPKNQVHAKGPDGETRVPMSRDATTNIPGPYAITVSDAGVSPGTSAATMTFTISLDRAPFETITVAYATSDGTAQAGTDYSATSGTLAFYTGQITKTVTVPVLANTAAEGDEDFTLTLSNPTGTAYVKDASATGAIAGNSPPAGAPIITGTPKVGQTLSLDISGVTDADGIDTATLSYQWQAGGADISGATSSTYTLTADEFGKAIQARFGFDDNLGYAGSVTSAPSPVVTAAANNVATGKPTITGTAQVGKTLTAGTGDISDDDGLNDVSWSYQWHAGGSDISGATSATLTLTADHQGKAVSVTVSFTDDLDNPESRTSDATAAVTGATRVNNPANGKPTITGTAQVGKTLTAGTGDISDDDGLNDVSWSYQWHAGGSDISGATSATLTLTADQQGKAVSVTVSFTDDLDNPESLTSDATTAVAGPPFRVTLDTVDDSHNGYKTRFYFTISFSEEPEEPFSYRTVRDHLFTVTNGTIKSAGRLDRPSNIGWLITVEAYGDSDVRVQLPRTTDCDAQGAVCTADGRMLSNSLDFTVPGPT